MPVAPRPWSFLFSGAEFVTTTEASRQNRPERSMVQKQCTVMDRLAILTIVGCLHPERLFPPQFRSPPAFRSRRHALLDMSANPRLMSDGRRSAIHGQEAETE